MKGQKYKRASSNCKLNSNITLTDVSNENIGISIISSINDGIEETTEDAALSSDTLSKSKRKSGSNWGKYVKKYRANWEADKKLKDWILPNPDCDTNVICRHCKCIIRAHKSDLYKHSDTKKHIEYSNTFSDEDYEQIVKLAKDKFENKGKKPKEKSPKSRKRGSRAKKQCLVVESGHEIYETHDGGYLMDFTEVSDAENTIEIKPVLTRAEEQCVSKIASRIGVILTGEIEKLLKTSVFLHVPTESGDLPNLNDFEHIKKITRICIGHLGQKYLEESLLEADEANKDVSIETGNQDISLKLIDIEEKLQQTFTEISSLKLSVGKPPSGSVLEANVDF